jgi:hypothetical protein
MDLSCWKRSRSIGHRLLRLEPGLIAPVFGGTGEPSDTIVHAARKKQVTARRQYTTLYATSRRSSFEEPQRFFALTLCDPRRRLIAGRNLEPRSGTALRKRCFYMYRASLPKPAPVSGGYSVRLRVATRRLLVIRLELYFLLNLWVNGTGLSQSAGRMFL